MDRQAVWRVRGDDPKTLWGWIWQSEWPRRLPPGWALTCAIAILVAAITITPWILLAVPGVIVGLGRTKRIPHDLAPLSTVPPPGPSFACRLSVERGPANTTIGVDEGVVTFVDGWLHFSGLRTEFSIRPDEVKGFGPVSTGPRLLLRDVTVELRDLDTSNGSKLLRAAQVWYQSVRAEGDAFVAPPGTVHPSAIAKGWIDAIRHTAFTVAVLSVFLLCVQLFSWDSGYFGCTVLFVQSDAWRRLRELKSLQARERRELANVSKIAIGH